LSLLLKHSAHTHSFPTEQHHKGEGKEATTPKDNYDKGLDCGHAPDYGKGEPDVGEKETGGGGRGHD